MQFKVRRILNKDIKNEISNIGFSPSYLDLGVEKHRFLNLKIYNLRPEAATILKETALSSNADAAVHKEVLGCKIENSNAVLSGSEKELKIIAEKLKSQPFSMDKVADEILKQIEIYNTPAQKPQIMGVLNVTENSSSDGGMYLDPKNALNHAYQMIEEGADIIDIGAESTQAGACAVPYDVEIQRLGPVVKDLKQNSKIKISIDTRNSETARVMADLGADIINDVSGLRYDSNMAQTIANTGVCIIIGHSRGVPENMDDLAKYEDVFEETYLELFNMVQTALNTGIQKEKIIIDPGFGFAKNIEQNFEILNKIEEFKSMGFPICAGVSRKRFIKSALLGESLEALDNLTACASFYLAGKNIDIIRVHNVQKTKETLNFAEKLYAH